MQIISLIQGLWVALIILMFFAKLRTGICLYVAYMILVPYMNINLGINLQWNLVNVLLLVAFFLSYEYGREERIPLSFKPFVPFLFLFIAQLLEMPFQNEVPLDYEFNFFRQQIMQYFILPFVIWNYSFIDGKLHEQLKNTVIICICIASGYGLYLTTTNGVNPYQIAVMAANGEVWNADYAAVGGGRLFGRISSVFGHPMTYGLFLGMAFIYIYAIKASLNKYKMIVILLAIVTSIFLCGIRSPIGAFFVTILVFLLLSHRIKLMCQVGIVGGIAYLIINSIPELSNYVGSIFSDDKSNVSGSSFEMRLNQMEGCFWEIRNHLVFGKGFGWTNYYMDTYGDHPIMLAFESLIYVVLCNSGIVGVVIWIIFLLKLFRNTSRIVLNQDIVICALTLTTYYITYSVITGEYEYMKYFMLFYTLMLLEGTQKTNNINRKNNL